MMISKTFVATILSLMVASAYGRKAYELEDKRNVRGANPGGLSTKPRRHLKMGMSDSADLKGKLGKRQQCSDERFTMICEWEANNARRLSAGAGASRAQLQQMVEDMRSKGLTHFEPNERRLAVELLNVKCTLGVGIKPPEPSSSDEEASPDYGTDYVEYVEEIPFPDERWCLIEKTLDGKDSGPGEKTANEFSFETKVTFEDVEKGDSTEDIMGSLTLEFFKIDSPLDTDSEDDLFYDGSSIGFSC